MVQKSPIRLIGNRSGALVAVCLTGYLAVMDFRAAFSHIPRKSRWLIPLDSLPLPIWAAVTINVAFYIYMLWLGVFFFRGGKGKERVVIAGFLTAALISPV